MTDKPKVFLTRRLPAASMDRLERETVLSHADLDRALTRQDLVAGVRDVDALLCLLTDQVDAELLDANPRLKVVSNYAVGYNNIDVDAATQRNVAVTNTPGVLTDCTADMAWALLMAAARRVTEGDVLVRSGNWTGWEPLQLLGAEVTGATIGLVGFGRIAKAIARRAHAFDMKVLYWNRTRLTPEEEAELGIQYVEKERLFSDSDFVSAHVALNSETVHLIGEADFARMKPSAYFINTTRGPVVDEKALVAALKANRIAGAGLDVFENEPTLEPELYDLENVTLAPHIGSATVGTRTRMGMMVIDNLLAGCRGERLPNILNPEVYETDRRERRL